jgi:DNA repair/transcription protein MET18/MMS19
MIESTSDILQILLVMVDSLAKLSMDVGDKDLVYSLLLVFSRMLMDEKGWTILLFCSYTNF